MENELKRIYYGGDYHMGNPDPKEKQFVCCFHCLMSTTICSILVLLWAGSTVAQRSSRWAESGGSLLLDGHLKTPFPFPLLVDSTVKVGYNFKKGNGVGKNN